MGFVSARPQLLFIYLLSYQREGPELREDAEFVGVRLIRFHREMVKGKLSVQFQSVQARLNLSHVG